MATNLNTASERELVRLPGVGSVIAKRIIAARPFTALAQLQQINGIGAKRYLALVSDRLVTIGAPDDSDTKRTIKPEPTARTRAKKPPLVDLNRASLHELQTLHGVGPNLAQRIVAARPFRRKSEVTAVRGIGLVTYEKMEPQLMEIRSAVYDDDDDESDKENEPQPASPPHASRIVPPPPFLTPQAPTTARLQRSVRLCDVPSRYLLDHIRASVLPQSTSKLLIASWNIRNLSKKRDAELLHRITDILAQFDIVAMQEVRDTIVLKRLKHFMPGWDYIASPLVGGDEVGGSQWRRRAEHFAYFYRRRIVTPVHADVSTRSAMVRPPYVATFETVGATTPRLPFTLVNTHIVCGDTEARLEEMNELWRLTTRLQELENRPNVVLLGDFNLAPHEIDDMGEGDQHFEPLILSPLSTTVGEKLLDNIWLNRAGKWESLELESGVYRIDWALYPRSKGLPRQHETQTSRIEAQTARIQCTLELSDHCPVWVALGGRENEE